MPLIWWCVQLLAVTCTIVCIPQELPWVRLDHSLSLSTSLQRSTHAIHSVLLKHHRRRTDTVWVSQQNIYSQSAHLYKTAKINIILNKNAMHHGIVLLFTDKEHSTTLVALLTLCYKFHIVHTVQITANVPRYSTTSIHYCIPKHLGLVYNMYTIANNCSVCCTTVCGYEKQYHIYSPTVRALDSSQS